MMKIEVREKVEWNIQREASIFTEEQDLIASVYATKYDSGALNYSENITDSKLYIENKGEVDALLSTFKEETAKWIPRENERKGKKA